MSAAELVPAAELRISNPKPSCAAPGSSPGLTRASTSGNGARGGDASEAGAFPARE